MKLEVGTLEEIGAQVGDVVELVEGAEGFKEYMRIYGGFKYTIGEYGPKSVIPGSGGGWSNLCKHKFRIVSRASEVSTDAPSPIRTRTVTEIVPGVYGKVVVASGNNEHAAISIGSERGPEWLNAAELRSAIATLTQISDAMEQQ